MLMIVGTASEVISLPTGICVILIYCELLRSISTLSFSSTKERGDAFLFGEGWGGGALYKCLYNYEFIQKCQINMFAIFESDAFSNTFQYFLSSSSG